MSLDHYGDLLSNEHAAGGPVPSAQFNTVVGVLDAQLVGALRGLGTGCVDPDGWVVAAGSGLSVNIGAGAGVAASGEGRIFLQTTTSQALALPANSTRVIYAAAVTRVAAGDPDSRESAVVEFTASATGGAVAGAIQIATVVTGAAGVSTVTDDRTFIRALEALEALESDEDSLAEVQAAIGSDYFGASPPVASLDTRLDDIEAAAGEADGVTAVFWGVLRRAAGNPATIEQYVGQQLQEHIEDRHAGDETFVAVAEPWDEDSVNQARHALRSTRATDNDLPDYLLESAAVAWGIYGDGTGTVDHVDAVNTTWV